MDSVHLGSGDRYTDGWINVDLYADADLKCDLRDVDFPKNSVEAVRCVHTIEHITQHDAIALIRRIAHWLCKGGMVEIETPDRKKCLQLIEEQAFILGAKGLLGGRSVDKPGWHKWIEEWAKREGIEASVKAENVGKVIIPTKWQLPGEQHLYVWEGLELARQLQYVGLQTKVGNPKHHGGRAWRDCRVVGVKP